MSDISTAAAGSKILWAAVGVLGTAVVGLGGALYYSQAHQAPEVTAPASTPASVSTHKPATTTKAAAHAPASAHALAAAPAQAKAPAARPVCLDCATVTAVKTIEREGQASGAGVVAGGVLGAVVGNQVGKGQGKDIATVVGAIGGGIAGNQIEKKMKKVTVYQVDLRMDDGSTRTMELTEAAAVGARVRVSGETLTPLPAGN